VAALIVGLSALAAGRVVVGCVAVILAAACAAAGVGWPVFRQGSVGGANDVNCRVRNFSSSTGVNGF